MYLDPVCKKNPVHRKTQSGFLVPLAAIIVVGIAILAIAIARFSGQAATATTQEGLAVQAYYAADSAAQYTMNRLFFNAPNKAAADTNCVNVSGSSLNYNTVGLAVCSSDITCSVSSIAGSNASYYLITSAASCGSGVTFAERTITVSAWYP